MKFISIISYYQPFYSNKLISLEHIHLTLRFKIKNIPLTFLLHHSLNDTADICKKMHNNSLDRGIFFLQLLQLELVNSNHTMTHDQSNEKN